MRDLTGFFGCLTLCVALVVATSPNAEAGAGWPPPCWSCGGFNSDCPWDGLEEECYYEDEYEVWDCTTTIAGPCPDQCECGIELFGSGGGPGCACFPVN